MTEPQFSQRQKTGLGGAGGGDGCFFAGKVFCNGFLCVCKGIADGIETGREG